MVVLTVRVVSRQRLVFDQRVTPALTSDGFPPENKIEALNGSENVDVREFSD